jgi:alpha-beta hydrolase superfamily lysophospholipase
VRAEPPSERIDELGDGASRFHRASDGVTLHYSHWPNGDDPRAILVYLHGIASHSRWFGETAVDLASHGVSVYAPDRRGSGRSQGARGDLPRYERALADVDEVLAIVRSENEGRPLFLAGSSWAAKLAVIYAAVRRESLSGLLLLGPGLIPRVTLPLPRQIEVIVGHLIVPTASVPIPLTPELYTTNLNYLDFIRNDELRLLTATTRFFWETARLDRRREQASAALRVPLLVIQGENDRMMEVPKTAEWFSRLRIDDKTYLGYPGGSHTLEFEADRARYVADISAWLLARSPVQSRKPRPTKGADG